MRCLARTVDRIVRVGAVIGGAFLIGIMLLTVANVVFRVFGSTISFTYEASILAIVVPVAFAFSYTALERSHISIELLLSRLSPGIRRIFEIFVCVIALCCVALLVWANIGILRIRSFGVEETLMYHFSYYPFRCTFLLGLILFGFVLLIDMVRTLSKAFRK
jgi:TRAP-type C4-dicarboxylate transport system permease small subunit